MVSSETKTLTAEDDEFGDGLSEADAELVRFVEVKVAVLSSHGLDPFANVLLDCSNFSRDTSLYSLPDPTETSIRATSHFQIVETAWSESGSPAFRLRMPDILEEPLISLTISWTGHPFDLVVSDGHLQ